MAEEGGYASDLRAVVRLGCALRCARCVQLPRAWVPMCAVHAVPAVPELMQPWWTRRSRAHMLPIVHLPCTLRLLCLQCPS